MKALALAALLLWACGPCWAARARATEAPAALDRLVKDDYNAVRRARYALRKAAPGTADEAVARRAVDDAKRKLKDDRLRLRELRRRQAEVGDQ